MKWPRVEALIGSIERGLATRILAWPEALLRRLAGPPIRSPEGSTLDLHTQVILRMMHLRGEPELHAHGHVAARRRFERTSRVLDRITGDVRVTNLTMPGGAGPRRARRYDPLGPDARGRSLLFLHGGGWVVGSLETHDQVCRALAAEAHLTVFALDYRLAPEDPFPAGLDDALAATRWLLAEADTLGLDPTQVSVGGDSAGGNLAAVTALALRAEARQPSRQLLIYPSTDATRSAPSQRHFAHGFVLTDRAMTSMLADYLQGSDARDPRVSPWFAPDLGGAPPAIIVTAGFDPLRDEGRAYAERLVAAGVTVTHLAAPTLVHGFLHLRQVVPEAARVTREIVKLLD